VHLSRMFGADGFKERNKRSCASRRRICTWTDRTGICSNLGGEEIGHTGICNIMKVIVKV
jgi:hypothetical protein